MITETNGSAVPDIQQRLKRTSPVPTPSEVYKRPSKEDRDEIVSLDAQEVERIAETETLVEERNAITRKSQGHYSSLVYDSVFCRERIWTNGYITYKCPLCSYERTTRRSISSHLRIHPKSQRDALGPNPPSRRIVGLSWDVMYKKGRKGNESDPQTTDDGDLEDLDMPVAPGFDVFSMTSDQKVELIRDIMDDGRATALEGALSEANAKIERYCKDLAAMAVAERETRETIRLQEKRIEDLKEEAESRRRDANALSRHVAKLNLDIDALKKQNGVTVQEASLRREIDTLRSDNEKLRKRLQEVNDILALME